MTVPDVESSAPVVRPGLTVAEAEARLRAHGPNRLPPPRRRSPLRHLAAQMSHFFALMLWVAAGLALIAGMPQLAVAIVTVVVINGVFAFLQEHRAEHAAERLRDLVPRRATVRRDGHRVELDAVDLVPGDMLLLAAGDRISADALLLEARAFAVDVSLLTGEAVPVWPEAGATVHGGTFVVEGEAEAEVVATGGHTRLATIAALTEHVQRPVSPLTRELHRVVRTVAVVAVSAGVLFFAVASWLGFSPRNGFLFAVGVTVALVPEGLLPTVTLSLARGAQRMAGRQALVRRMESVETLGSTTFVCTDKTGTLTCNQMSVVTAWTPAGTASISGSGYAPDATVEAAPAVRAALDQLALAGLRCSDGRVVEREGGWAAVGDPMEAAIHCLALRLGIDGSDEERRHPVRSRVPFDPRRKRMSVVAGDRIVVKGAPDAVLALCVDGAGAHSAVDAMTASGLRVLAVAERPAPIAEPHTSASEVHLSLVGLLGFEDPPRPHAAAAIAACRDAGIAIAMVTGDHPATALAIAREVGLLAPDELVVEGRDLPADDDALAALVDHDGIVISRVEPEDKLRIARALQTRGHVVAMTGDGVNDGPALREADIGIAMGQSGTDVAREAADLVLLNDDFATIVAAVVEGRATFANIRRFLTYHLTDNVAELTPFVVWALSGGSVPLALGVLQILALDIGTDLLPALALGAEPAAADVLRRPPEGRHLIDRALLVRVFGVLGPAEAVAEMVAFLVVLLAGGWALGATPTDALLLAASGTAFTAVVIGQMANAFACRSARWGPLRLGWRSNRLLLGAVMSELVLLVGFLAVPALARALEHRWPTALGLGLALFAAPGVLGADAVHKRWRGRRRRSRSSSPPNRTGR